MSAARWWAKANAYSLGWEDVFGSIPSINNVCLGLSVAEHETRCGDAWPGEFNWGAIQKRSLNAQEKQTLANAGIGAAPNTVSAARVALAAAGNIASQAALHVDSAPGKGWYFVYFWSFANDEEAASFFVKTLAKNRRNCKAVLELIGATPFDLAHAMYMTGYFEGFHAGARPYNSRIDPLTPPELANVQDYASALTRHVIPIRDALSLGWSHNTTALPPPPAPPDPKTFDLFTIVGVQKALNFLGEGLIVDGVNGSRTQSAVKTFQYKHGLAVDGQVGPITRAALSHELGLL